jgi:hypothetical protein
VFGSTANVDAIFAPTDYNGKMCGVDYPTKPYGYVVNLYLDVVCVEHCPGQTKTIDLNKNAYDQMICKKAKDFSIGSGDDAVSGKLYSEAACTDDDKYGKEPCYNPVDIDYYLGYLDLFCSDSSDATTCGKGVCNFKLKSYAVGYYCMFDTEDVKLPVFNIGTEGDDANSATIASKFALLSDDMVSFFASDADENSETSSGVIGAFLQDLYTAKDWIFGFGFVVCLFVAFGYTKLMSTFCLDILVWGCIFLTGALFVVLGAYSYTIYNQWKDEERYSDASVTGMQVISIIFIVLAVLYWCFIACICSKIKLCIALTKVAGAAVRDVPLVVLFPLIQVAGLVLFLVPWIYYMFYLHSQGCYKEVTADDDGASTTETWIWSSSGGYPDNCKDQSVDYPSYENTLYAQYYMMFCYFWTSQFIVAMGQLIMALVFFLWYFTEDPATEVEGNDDRGCFKRWFCAPPHNGGRDDRLLFHAFGQSCYHVGSAAFGSLVIAIIKFIRYCIMKLQQKAEKGVATCPLVVQTTCPPLALCWGAMAGSTIKIIFCCLQCCLCCIEKCMKFINKHAYIIIVIHGDVSFCSAAVRSFFLILRNIRLIAAITLVQEFVIIIGKFFVIITTGCVSFVVPCSSLL